MIIFATLFASAMFCTASYHLCTWCCFEIDEKIFKIICGFRPNVIFGICNFFTSISWWFTTYMNISVVVVSLHNTPLVASPPDVHLPKYQPVQCHQWGDQPFDVQPAGFPGGDAAYYATHDADPALVDAFHPIGREPRLQHDSQPGVWHQLRWEHAGRCVVFAGFKKYIFNLHRFDLVQKRFY